jgi:hypothetical protein
MAVEELSDFLRFLGNRGLYHEERNKARRLETELRQTRRQLNLRLAALGGVLALGLAVTAAFAASRHWHRHRAPLVFPDTAWRKRFGAMRKAIQSGVQ